MKEYLKSEQEENTYALLERYEFDSSMYLVDYGNPIKGNPVNGRVVGTYAVYESGYDYDTGRIYDECFVEFYG